MAKKSSETGDIAPQPEAQQAQVPAPEPMNSLTLTLAGLTAGFQKTQQKEPTKMTTIKTAEDIIAFNQANVEAVVKSGQIWAAGVQDLSKTFAATAQAQIDEALAAVKALAGVKSLKDAVDLQTNLAKSSLEKAVAETSKLTEASLKLAEQAWAPVTARVTLAVEKFGRAA
jgi:phasin family protein